MTLQLPVTFDDQSPVGGQDLQDALDVIALQFPVSAANLVGSLQGTSLPTSPSHGQDYYYAADAANGVVWHLKYDATSASTYKWAYVGGNPLWSEITTNESTASTTYAALATAGPSISTPALAGDWDVEIGCEAYANAAQDQFMSYDIGGTGAVDGDAIIVTQASATNAPRSCMRARRKTAVAASTAFVAKYKQGGVQTGNYRSRWMRIRPVRVI